jgi:hypothetical protein
LGEGLPGRAVKHDRAAIHHDDAGDAIRQLVHAVLDHHDRGAVLAVEPGEDREDLGHAGGVEIGGGFVEHQQARAPSQHGGDTHALLLAAGEIEDRAVAEPLQPDGREGLHLPVEDLGGRAAEVLHAEADLVPHAGVDDLPLGVLEDHADGGREGGDPRLRQAMAADGGSAGECPLERMGDGAVQQLQQGALAAAAGAEDEHELAFAHPQRDVAQNRQRLTLVGIGDATDVDDGVGHRRAIR